MIVIINKIVIVLMFSFIFFLFGIDVGTLGIDWLTSDWISAIGSWISGIIAGWALFYAINKDRIDLDRKIRKLNNNISALTSKKDFINERKKNLQPIYDNLSKRTSYMLKDSISTKGFGDSINSETEKELKNEVSKIKNGMSLGVLDFPDSNLTYVNTLTDRITTESDFIQNANTSTTDAVNRLIDKINALLLDLDKYSREMGKMISIAELTKNID